MKSYVILLVVSSVLAISCAAPILEEEEDLDHVDEFGEYFEGDMLLTAVQREAIENAMDVDGASRNGLRNGAKRWPNRTVVYHINEDDFDEEQLAMIENGLADIANKSCLKFVKREKEDEHAVIIQGTANGCFSNVGFNIPDDDGEVHQLLNLAKGCFKHGTVVHEMLHTLGFYHMQSTYDRDDFITIVWENILPGTEHNFAKYNNDTVTDFGVPYDYDSVMHYPEKAFSKNGNKTIIPLQANVTIGQRNGLSESDILKLNKMYCEDSDDVEDQPVKSDGHDKEILGSENGCYSNVGFTTPGDDDGEEGEVNQVLNLAKGCFKHGTVVHEMLHTLGFYHMQSTYDRDDFVTIVWENISEGHEHNFAKYNNDTVTDFGVPYDYDSVMHYSEKAFSKNGNKTIIPIQEGAKIGQRNGLSESDILKLNRMYCEDANVEAVATKDESGNLILD